MPDPGGGGGGLSVPEGKLGGTKVGLPPPGTEVFGGGPPVAVPPGPVGIGPPAGTVMVVVTKTVDVALGATTVVTNTVLVMVRVTVIVAGTMTVVVTSTVVVVVTVKVSPAVTNACRFTLTPRSASCVSSAS